MKKSLVILLVTLAVLLFTLSCTLYEHDFAPAGTRRALIYGVSDYSFEPSDPHANPDLVATYFDALEMEKTFSHYGFNTLVKYDSDVTKSQILDIDLKSFEAVTTEDDVTLFYFSGHGGFYSDESFLVPDFDNPGLSYENDAIFASELIAALQKISGKKLIILDICNSGGFVSDSFADIDSLPDDYEDSAGKSTFSDAWEKYVRIDDTMYTHDDIWVISSSGANELAYETKVDSNNGDFTYFLLKSLGFDHKTETIHSYSSADANRDGHITVTELYSDTFTLFNKDFNNDVSKDGIREGELTATSAEPYYSHLSGGPDDLILIDLH